MVFNRSYFPIICIILCCLISCDNKTQDRKDVKSKTSPSIQTVEVVYATNRSFSAEVLITGTARPNQMVELFAMESGVLSAINKDIGDQVNKGEVLAVLDNPELLQQELKLVVECEVRKTNYNRLKGIFDQTPALITIQQLEIAEGEYLASKAKLSAMKSRLSFLIIKAPFSGVITHRYVDIGALVQSGLSQNNTTSIFQIQDISPIRLTLMVPESDASLIKKGTSVEFVFPELSGESIKSNISRLSRVLDEKSKTMQVEIDVPNKAGNIIPGMYAKVNLMLDSKENRLSLPVSSKIRYKNEDYVLVVENQKIKRVPVKIGLSDNTFFEVLNSEINDNSIVVLKGKGLVNQGQTVKTILKQE